ncbi:MAG: hypothetical protein NTY68_02775 [Candidatus Micrarchaeota archaeon]|nr:hypothetical protein [Candidatus Micrarchaeota archaeon]
MAFVGIEKDIFAEKHETIKVFALCFAIFLVPLLFSQQLIAGTLVNAMLIYSALRIKGSWSYVPAVIPSVAAMLAGVLFGAAHAVLLMLPFIWLGNMSLIFVMKSMKDYARSLATAAAVKTAILSVSVLALATFAGVPSALISSFTYLQLVTAISGGILAFVAMKGIIKRNV